MNNRVFMIEKEDGTASSGTMRITFSKGGKVWRAMSRVKGHFSMFTEWDGKKKRHVFRLPRQYENAYVVEYELVPIRRTPVSLWVKKHLEKK